MARRGYEAVQKDGLLCFRVKLIRIGIIGKRRIEGGLKDERMAYSVLELNLIGNGIIGSWKEKKFEFENIVEIMFGK